MLYESTRGSEKKLKSSQAIIQGISEDKGLYVPVEFPKLTPKLISAIKNQNKGEYRLAYKDIAKEVIGAFFDDFTESEMDYCINGAYDKKFTANDIVELKNIGNANFLELYHGKTAAFKDMALSILPYLMTTSIKKEGIKDKVCILTATSGDTGKAALEGFSDVEGTEIVVFYPKGGVSEVQERQMITQDGENTHVFSIEGNFDDAQTGVKKIFNDDEFRTELTNKGIRLSSANSINIGRLVPQVAYYVYSYIKLVENGKLASGDEMNVVVPTGNFGNILAAYFAREMGVPIKKFICASNDNKVLTDFINTGVYDIRPEARGFMLTNSPSMDILISSNLERMLYLMAKNGNLDAGKVVSGLMQKLDTEKVYTISQEMRDEMNFFFGGYATEKETLNAISELWENEHYLMDTHTAVAYKVYKDYVKSTGDDIPTVIASTASAYKFAEAASGALGLKTCTDGFSYIKELEKLTNVKVPYGLKDLDKKEIKHNKTVKINEMKNAVKSIL